MKQRVPLFLMVLLMLLSIASELKAQNYCVPHTLRQDNYGIGISNFVMGSISNNTGTPTPTVNYFNYTNLSTSGVIGSSVSYSITLPSGNNARVSILVDWNNDGTFGVGTNEQMLVVDLSSGSTYNSSFVVPGVVSPGAYRMRVMADLNGNGPNPCLLQYSGEVEDYTFIAVSPTFDAAAVNLNRTFTSGNNNLQIAVANTHNATALTSVTIGYQLNNGTPQTQNVTSLSINPGTFSNLSFSTPLNIPAGSHTLKIWIADPNGNTGTNRNNDTLRYSFVAGQTLNGAYTINPAGSGSTNFTSFTNAVSALRSFGISGPVTFSVAAGTYLEQISIPEISGTSTVNTITFDGGAGNNTSRIISFGTTSATDFYTVRIQSGKYITFKNLSIRSTGANYGYGVQIMNGSSNITFENTIIQTSDANTTTANTALIPVIFSNSFDAGQVSVRDVFNVTFESNRISGGYYNVLLNGWNQSTIYDIVFNKNEIADFYYYGLYVNNIQNIRISGNKILQRQMNYTAGYGMYIINISTSNRQMEVYNNEFLRCYQYAMFFSSVTNSVNRARVYNNIMGAGLNNATAFLAVIQSSTNFDFFHNTLTYNLLASAGTTGPLNINAGSGHDIRNNIFSITQIGSASVCLATSSTTVASAINNNVYHKAGADAGSTLVNIGGNLLSSQTIRNNFTFNSLFFTGTPLFLSTTNFRLSNAGRSPFGESGLGISTDIDGNNRCSLFPSIGASESQFAEASGTGIIVADSVFVNSPVAFYNTNAPGLPKQHVWNIDNGASFQTSLHANYTFTAVGQYEVRLTTTSCTGVDTAYKLVTVVTPTTAPVSGFLASSNLAEQGYELQLIDQSSGGASSWNWTITPDAGVTFVNGRTAQNPRVIFTNPGLYEVCLVASNAAGAGNQACRTDYIRVIEATSMCGTRIVSKTANAKLYDDGGKFGAYGNSRNCGFLIDPCASSVTLKFNAFQLESGDFLRVYDGADANGRVLHTGSGFSGAIIPSDLTASTGKMFIQLVTNSTGNSSGFEAEWTSTPKQFNKPVAAFRAPDTLYVGAPFTFISNSTGLDPVLSWDFNNDGISDANTAQATYTFTTPGTYLTRLTISDCGGIDGAARSIIVINAFDKPKPDFVTNYRTISSGESVKFFDRSTQAPYNFTWTITPATFTYINGTDSTSRNPEVRFTAVGNYSVSLRVENLFGADSIVRTGYIKVVEYCFPGAGLNTDLGISRVTFAGIDNVSLIGPATYTNYTQSVAPATLQKGTKYPIVLERLTTNEDMTHSVWIDFNGNGVFEGSEQVLATLPNKQKVLVDTILVPLTVDEGSTRMRIGTSYGSTRNAPCGINPFGEFEDYTVSIFNNLVKPVITILGNNPETIEAGTSYVEAGATAVDDLNGNLTSSIIISGNVNTQVAGTYFVRYNVSDLDGNSAEEVRTVIVVTDFTAPVITLNGNNPEVLVFGTPYQEAGFSVLDNLDGVIPNNRVSISGFVNSFQLGTYQLTYSVSDNAGNIGSIIRTVIIGDTTVPVILLKGADTVTIALGATYTDDGAIVLDNNQVNLPYQVDLSVIDNSVVGDYTLVYTAIDSSGNQATPVNRIIRVRDFIRPQLSLIGDTVVLDVFRTYNEPGFTATDNYDQNVQVNITGSVNTSVVDVYVLVYQAEDQAGNLSDVKIRIVKVIDRLAPVITLKGDKILTVCKWRPYVDSGYVVTDNYDTEFEVEVSGQVNTTEPGLYVISYKTRDKAGNESVTAERLIRVIDCKLGLADESLSATVYPNPGQGLYTISYTDGETLSVQVVDILGKVVEARVEKSGETTWVVELPNALPGTYFFRLTSGDAMSVIKVQKMN